MGHFLNPAVPETFRFWDHPSCPAESLWGSVRAWTGSANLSLSSDTEDGETATATMGLWILYMEMWFWIMNNMTLTCFHLLSYGSFFYVLYIYGTYMTGWWLVVWNIFVKINFHILGMSSSQLTFTPSFFRGVGSTTNQNIINHH